MRLFKRAAYLAVLMFVNYGINAVSFRLLARGSYFGVAASDAVLAWWGFTMTKRIVAAESRWEQLGVTVGGILGSVFGLWLTR